MRKPMYHHISNFLNRLLLPALFFLSIIAGTLCLVNPAMADAAGKVLALGSTLKSGVNSPEVIELTNLGYEVEIANDSVWSAKTTTDFRGYKAIILADRNCSGNINDLAAAEANKNVWGPAVNGNVIIIGADPSYHYGGTSGATNLVRKGVAFAVNEAGKTGAYITMSCYYGGADPSTPVPVLDAFSTNGFTTTAVPGCFDDVKIVAEHPALAGLTSADLSDWGCSVHEAFDKWPVAFEVLALARSGEVYTAADGTVGTPYILARSHSLMVISDISLTPVSAANPLGDNHTLTATVTEDTGEGGIQPIPNKTVTFTVIDGPNKWISDNDTGVKGTAITNTNGEAAFSYSSSVTGTDTIQASFNDSSGVTQRSNNVTKTWGALGIKTENLASAPAGQPYTATLQATGGTSPYTWHITYKAPSTALSMYYHDNGSPEILETILNNLSINAETGVLTWNPLPRIPEGKTLYFIDITIEVADSAENSATATFRYTDPPLGSTASDADGAGGGCFIATAAFGSPVEKHVTLLKQFRDQCLLSTSLGRDFVAAYYRYSPPAADYIAVHENLRTVVRWSLLPLVGASWLALKIGLLPLLVLFLAMGLVSGICIRQPFKTRKK